MDNSLSTMNPEVAKEWHPTKNGSLTPSDISYGSKKFVWWLGACGHEWEAKPNTRTARKRSCPYCSGNKVLKGFNDLESKYPDIAKEWHPTKNDLSPSEVSYGSRYSSWWLSHCGHEWQSSVSSRVRNNGFCPFCINKFALKGFNDLESKYPDIAKEWHPSKNALLPSEVVGESGRKAWWICKEGHEWETQVRVRTTKNGGCRICSNKLALTGFNDLATTHPELANEWHPNKNAIKANEVTAGTPSKYWWRGSCGHEWQAQVRNRAKKEAYKSSGCPTCSKGGFNQNTPSIFYFLYNQNLGCYKIGITASKSRRISRFKKEGWILVYQVLHDTGHEILNLETEILKWIRKDLKLPVAIKPWQTTCGGFSETFTDNVKEDLVIKKINETWELLKTTSLETYAS